MNVKQIAENGILKQNPVFRLALGACPVLATTTTMSDALGMGAAVLFVLLCSNVLISLLRNIIPDKVRIPVFILIIATFVTIVILVVDKFLPDLYESLGIFLPLIVVNCLILARAESFASGNSVKDSALDGVFMGVGFALALLCMAFVRELLGMGSLFGVEIWAFSISIFSQSAGGFLTFGVLIALFNFLYGKFQTSQKKRQSKKTVEVK